VAAIQAAPKTLAGKAWRDVKLPAGRILIPGLVSQAAELVDHPEPIA